MPCCGRIGFRSRPTPLQQVCIHLQQTLKAGVVLDKAALERQNVKPEDPLQLELEGVRLKTGLKLLFDQLGLTYRIIPEDNLMIVTDREGSDEPTDRIWSELKALHRDLHDLQDTVDELRDSLGDQEGDGPQVRNPTIIEEMPEPAPEKPGTRLEKPGGVRQNPTGRDLLNRARGRLPAGSFIRSAPRPAVSRSGPSADHDRFTDSRIAESRKLNHESRRCKSEIRSSRRRGSGPLRDSVSVQEQGANVSEPERSPSPRQGRRSRGAAIGNRWLREPKVAVWAILAIAVLLGGGRKLLLAWRARKAAIRLEEPKRHPPGDRSRRGARPCRCLRAVADLQLNRVRTPATGRRKSTGPTLAARPSRGRGRASRRPSRIHGDLERPPPLSSCAANRDPDHRDLRGSVSGRRRPPRRTGQPGMVVRVLGARRAALETFSPWTAGRGQFTFNIVPGDFETNGPHRLVLETRVRTAAGLTDSWEITLPHIPFNFEFDPILQLDAILTLPDAVRDEAVAGPSGWCPGPGDGDQPTYLALGEEWALRNPPRLEVATPLACDLAHAVAIEFEGSDEWFPAGRLILSGQGLPRQGSPASEVVIRRFELGPISECRRRSSNGRASAGCGSRSRPIPASDGPTPKSARSGPAAPRLIGSRSRSCGGREPASTVSRDFPAQMIVAAKIETVGLGGDLSLLVAATSRPGASVPCRPRVIRA